MYISGLFISVRSLNDVPHMDSCWRGVGLYASACFISKCTEWILIKFDIYEGGTNKKVVGEFNLNPYRLTITLIYTKPKPKFIIFFFKTGYQ